MRKVHPLYWLAAAGGFVILVWAWVALIGARPQQSMLWLVVVASLGVIVGFAGTLGSFYGSRAPSMRRRLVLDSLSISTVLPRSVPFLTALVLGNVVGRLLLPADLYIEDIGVGGWNLVLLGVLFGLLSVGIACLATMLVVVPVAWLVASFLPDRARDEPRTWFAVMSTRELRGSALVVLSIAWLIPGLLLGGYRVGGQAGTLAWYLSCVLAIALIVVGVVINNRAVKVRNRGGVTTPFDDGLL